MRWLNVARARRPGQASIEFAIGLTMFLILVVGAVDLGRAVWVWNTMAHAAREAARYGSMPTHTSTQIRDYAVARATGIGLTSANVTVTRGVCGTPSSPIVVSITYSFAPINLPIAAAWGGGATIPLNASSSMYVEQGVPPCAT
jgi:Flp pilus assembly protein TadG